MLLDKIKAIWWSLVFNKQISHSDGDNVRQGSYVVSELIANLKHHSEGALLLMWSF